MHKLAQIHRVGIPSSLVGCQSFKIKTEKNKKESYTLLYEVKMLQINTTYIWKTDNYSGIIHACIETIIAQSFSTNEYWRDLKYQLKMILKTRERREQYQLQTNGKMTGI